MHKLLAQGTWNQFRKCLTMSSTRVRPNTLPLRRSMITTTTVELAPLGNSPLHTELRKMLTDTSPVEEGYRDAAQHEVFREGRCRCNEVIAGVTCVSCCACRISWRYVKSLRSSVGHTLRAWPDRPLLRPSGPLSLFLSL